MHDDNYLVRSPLLDPQQRVLGYKLGWQEKTDSARTGSLARLAGRLSGFPGGAGLGTVFLDGNPLSLPVETLQAMSPHDTVWLLGRTEFSQASRADLLALREKGFGLALRGADRDILRENEALLSAVTHLEIQAESADLVAVNDFARQRPFPISLLAVNPAGWTGFETCAALGLPVFFGALCRTPRTISGPGVLTSQAALILQLMQMVSENADVRHLEELLKRDAVLSYKLFRYINSASFGMDVEVQSLRHAVAMLGYAPLFRWLSMLLAVTSAVNFSPALLQAAIIRGRLSELLGNGLLSRSESDDLFVVGMFSLLAQMLGVPASQLLDQIVLPEAIAQAVLSREGKYGPFLSLAEACESEDADAGSLADTLFLTEARVNDAHLSAMAWARNIRF